MSIIKKKKKIKKIKNLEGNGKTAGISQWVDPCQKIEKWKKENSENLEKKYIFHFTWRTSFLEIIQTSRNLPRQYEERDLGISQ